MRLSRHSPGIHDHKVAVPQLGHQRRQHYGFEVEETKRRNIERREIPRESRHHNQRSDLQRAQLPLLRVLQLLARWQIIDPIERCLTAQR